MNNRTPHKRIVLLLLVSGFLGACSGIKPYHHTAEKNLTVQTVAESGSIFSSVKTSVHIFSVGADCRKEYQGTIKLNASTVEIGLPANDLSQLNFVFSSSTFLSNTSRAITYETRLKPRSGRHYDVQVKYLDDIYDVEIEETLPGQAAGRKIDSGQEIDCLPQKASL